MTDNPDVDTSAVSQAPPLASAIRLYAKTPRTRVLGPFLRFALWVQGCPFRCPGCMTPASQPLIGGAAFPIAALVDEILATPDIEGLTLSGGEPFAQAAELHRLVRRVRARRDLGVIVYSGYQLATLRRMARNDQAVAGLLAQTDLLIDGPYVQARDDGAPLRGSTNQRVLPLTARYQGSLDCYAARQPRGVELHVESDGLMLVGIPSHRQLAWWQARQALHQA